MPVKKTKGSKATKTKSTKAPSPKSKGSAKASRAPQVKNWVGALAPDVEVQDHAGERVCLRGDGPMVLFFYPKDMTPGCTREACEFGETYTALGRLGYAVFGISPDSAPSHQKFRDRYSLPYPLLTDADAVVAKKFGVWVKKTLYGRQYYGIARTTFVIDESGSVIAQWNNVKVDGHASEVLNRLKEMKA